MGSVEELGSQMNGLVSSLLASPSQTVSTFLQSRNNRGEKIVSHGPFRIGVYEMVVWKQPIECSHGEI